MMIDPSPITGALLAGARDAAKAYLRIDSAAEDGLLDTLIAQAVALAEAFTGQILLTRECVEMLTPRAQWQRLTTTPVRALALIEAVSADGSAQTLPATSFAFDVDARGDGWVRMTLATTLSRLRIRVTAGLAPRWADLPEPLQLGIVRLAAHYFTHRDAADDAGPPAAVAALLAPWRRMRLS
ncbi:MAG: hypothetical protein RL425_1324 [Pseudomonadota bacterium]|jgi:uncharacterized phiE125 gp8 family phage protein